MPDLRPLEEADADELYRLIDANRSHLAPWLPWAADQTLELTREFLRLIRTQETTDNGFQRAILVDGAIAGVAGFHNVNWPHGSTSVGYWLAEAHQGRGLMTGTVRALVDHAFGKWHLHRVEIRAAVGNHRSRAIPERLGFREEEVLRGAELVGGRYLDLVVYGILAPDWVREAA